MTCGPSCSVLHDARGGQPLTDIRTIVELIGATTNKGGLTVQATYDPGWYAKGIKITDTQLDSIPYTATTGTATGTTPSPPHERRGPIPRLAPNSQARIDIYQAAAGWVRLYDSDQRVKAGLAVSLETIKDIDECTIRNDQIARSRGPEGSHRHVGLQIVSVRQVEAV